MSSAIVTYKTPITTAKERARIAWDMVELPADEQRRHERMIAAIRKIQIGEAMQEEPTRDMYKWRKRYNAHLKKQLRDTCGMCLGTGEITVSDGHGCVEYDACPRCSWFEPYTDDYPTADDAMEVKF